MNLDFSYDQWNLKYKYRIWCYTKDYVLISKIENDLIDIKMNFDMTTEKYLIFGGGISNLLKMKIYIGENSEISGIELKKGDFIQVDILKGNEIIGDTYKTFIIDSINNNEKSILEITGFDSLYYLQDIYKYNEDDFPCTIKEFIKKIYILKGIITETDSPNLIANITYLIMNKDTIITKKRGRFLDGMQYLNILRDIAELNNLILRVKKDLVPYFTKMDITMINAGMTTTYRSMYFNIQQNNYITKMDIDERIYNLSGLKTKWRNQDIVKKGISPSNVFTDLYTNNNNICPFLFSKKNDSTLINDIYNNTLNPTRFTDQQSGEIESKVRFCIDIGDYIKIQNFSGVNCFLVTNIEINNFKMKIKSIPINNDFFSEKSIDVQYTENYKEQISSGGAEGEIQWYIGANSSKESSLSEIEIPTTSISVTPKNLIINDIENELLKNSNITINYNLPIVIYGYYGNYMMTPCDIDINVKVAIRYGFYSKTYGRYYYKGKSGEKIHKSTIKSGKALSIQNFETYITDSISINVEELLENENSSNTLFFDLEYIFDFSWKNNTINTYNLAWGSKTEKENLKSFNICYKNIFREKSTITQTYIFNYLSYDGYLKPDFVKEIYFDTPSMWKISNPYIKSNVNGISNGHSYGYLRINTPNKLRISINAKTSGENSYDYGYCYISTEELPFSTMKAYNVKEKKDFGGTWLYTGTGTDGGFGTFASGEMPPGEYYISFGYIKDGSGNVGDDCIYIDNIKIQELF